MNEIINEFLLAGEKIYASQDLCIVLVDHSLK